MTRTIVLSIAALTLAISSAACDDSSACHNDDCSHCHDVECGQTPDAPGDDAPSPDEPMAAVAMVACDVPVALTIGTEGGSFEPETGTIASGQVVKFALGDGLEVRSGTPSQPTETFAVVADATGCFRFQQPGTYPFFSSTHAIAQRHNVAGSIVVQ